MAAASIIAREAFLRALIKMGKQYDIEFKKGASAAVREAAVDLVKAKSPEVLLQTAKCHFKTTEGVLGELGLKRDVLPPEGQVTSKPYTYRGKKKS